MESNSSREIDWGKLIDEAMFQSGFASFYDYLETIVNFLDNERKSHDKSIDEISRKLSSGEIKPPDDPGQMPSEFEFDYYRLERISEFENILFSSFIVTIYSYLESKLISYCRDLEKQSPQKVLWSDLAGKNVVDKAMTYLIKVQQIELSLGSSTEWEKIQKIRSLRNQIVHEQGGVDGYSGETPKDFCLDALNTISSFLHSVMFAKVKAQ